MKTAQQWKTEVLKHKLDDQYTVVINPEEGRVIPVENVIVLNEYHLIDTIRAAQNEAIAEAQANWNKRHRGWKQYPEAKPMKNGKYEVTRGAWKRIVTLAQFTGIGFIHDDGTIMVDVIAFRSMPSPYEEKREAEKEEGR